MFPSEVIHVYDRHDDPEIDLICAGQFPALPVQWLWPGRIPGGKITLLTGDPGTGKSLVALDIAARVTRGAAWPDAPVGPPGRDGLEAPDAEPLGAARTSASSVASLAAPPASVLVLSAEDDLRDTIRPRLEAAGADVNRVYVLPGVADLRHDFAQLHTALNRVRDCRLIIIDPINAYVGPNDSHFQTVVRKVLSPLARLAAKRRIAVVAIAHHRKTDGAAFHRATGSMGFVAAARAVWAVRRDPENPARQLLLPVKTNLVGPSAARGLAYTIEPHGQLASPNIAWETATAVAPADPPREMAASNKTSRRGPEAAELNLAAEWLCQVLATGPRKAAHVTDEGMQRGFADRTIRRALHAIDGITTKSEYLGEWIWSLPASEIETAPETEPQVLNKTNSRPFVGPLPNGENPSGDATHPEPAKMAGPSSQPSKPQPEVQVESGNATALDANREPPQKLGHFDKTWPLQGNSNPSPPPTPNDWVPENPAFNCLLDALRKPSPSEPISSGAIPDTS